MLRLFVLNKEEAKENEGETAGLVGEIFLTQSREGREGAQRLVMET